LKDGFISHLTYLVQLPYLGKSQNTKNDQFRRKEHIGNRAVADRILCVSTRTLRMSKTLCSVRKTIQKRTDWIVRSHVKLAFI